MKIVIVWISISLVVQLSFLFFLNNFVFKNIYEFSSKKIESTISYDKDINMIISQNAKGVDVSYEGRYVVYSKDNILFVGDIKTNTINKIPINKGESVMHYEWLENRDILIIIKKVHNKIQLVSYYVKKDIQQVVKDVCNYKKGLEFKGITMSVLTGVYYINIKDNDKNKVYRIDRNDDLSIIDTSVSSLSVIKTIKHTDRLIYQADNNGSIFITSPNEKITLDSKSKLSLLDVGVDDTVYIGEIANNKVISIFCRRLDSDSTKWNNIQLCKPVDESSIYFNNKSEILINNEDNHTIENINTKQKTEYKGNFVKIIDKFVVSIDENGKLIYTYLD